MAVATVTTTINGQTYTLTYNSTSLYWETTLTAPTQTSGSNNAGVGPGVGADALNKGYYPVSVTATDDATNVTTVNDQSAGAIGQACRLKVLEKVLPTVTITYPTEGSFITTATPAIGITCYDAGSGIKPDTCLLKIDDGAPIPITLTVAPGDATTFTGVYTVATPLTDGPHNLKCGVSDYDGNAATTAQVNFTVDTLAPSLTVTSPTEGLVTNQQTINVVGTATDISSPPVTVTITVNGTDAGAVTVDESGNFTKAITLTQGANVIIVKATDTAGKYTEVTRNVTLNTTAPVIAEILIVPNPADAGQTYIIKAKVTDVD